MGTIKDINDLTTQFIKSIKDRYLVAKMVGIQSLISTVQSENSTLHSKNLELNKSGWQCEHKDCGCFYDDPNWQPPPQNIDGGPNSWMRN